jgi:hypothetical protein
MVAVVKRQVMKKMQVLTKMKVKMQAGGGEDKGLLASNDT